MTSKIAVIGFGNIAKAIITPLFDKKLLKPKDVYCLVNTKKSLENIRKNYKYDINIFQANSKGSEIIWDCEVKFLSVKPQQLKNIIELEKNKNYLLVSILAGVSLEKLIKKFPNHKCVRVVTNIPITIGKGLTGISWGDEIKEAQKQFIKRLFENSSKIYEFPEDLLDIFLSLTSSGPAIVALIIEALSDGGLSGGLQKRLSEELVVEMILGTVSLIKETNLTTAELKNMVTSPGGTTISALRVLENRSLRSALIEAVVSASNRSKEFR
ncbi:Delta 1-pyrroline-5-carboxylate reductase [Prochlorococcus marinus subsp. pastoris str. CCMP1986]|uniref:Pyrroline-5-carboxylate reductase n=1 Tax=Prochlorococcus marinus subsp. pastoris (strain CCMP1986 / NIES-2087 / MED4) TaxID=59919 RepID=Q7V2S1_PROMP|nr:pyrroline-5-carboxylate reductase [Prochlorococcus marinus]KGF86261.1 Pyrroline-5-carboxylate reductase [Prochlorococcus marinus str. EQPAC1]CAE18855.1 Delta 1-pyrroline-5-carboxylate reductase [Prochlorococcus marinus subsp. pastoris str. CCMP1986]